MIRSHDVICPTCKAEVAIRINRNGFWQRHVLGFFGYYPWKCGACGVVFLYRRRGHGHRSSRSESSADGNRAA
jgi:hypothetical protein